MVRERVFLDLTVSFFFKKRGFCCAGIITMCHYACLFLNLNIPKVVAKKEDPVFLLIPYFKGVGRLVLYGETLYCSTKIGLLLNLMFAVVLGLLKDFSIVYTVVPRAWTPPNHQETRSNAKIMS